MDKCPHHNCFADDNTTCTLGHLRLDLCPEWKRVSNPTVAITTTADEMLLPWTGLAMGESDLNFVNGRGKPITVGVVGPESAGKTTILGSFYLLLGRGALTNEAHAFSNSYTLTGWEAVATSMRWKPGPQPPRFPPHTPSSRARAPGMLHLAFRRENGSLRDLLLADFGSVAVLTVSTYFLVSRFPLLMRRRITTAGKLPAYIFQIGLLAAGISLSLFLLKRADLAYAEGLNPHPVLHRSDSSDINIAVGENSKWKEPVFILCDYPDPAYPLLFNLERSPGAYLVNGRPMRLLQTLLRLGPLTGDYLEFYEHIKDSLCFSFEQRRPQLVFVHGTDAMEFLTAAGLRPPLEADYDRIEDVLFLTDNVAPREFLGFYIDCAQFKRKPNGK